MLKASQTRFQNYLKDKLLKKKLNPTYNNVTLLSVSKAVLLYVEKELTPTI
jgi:hypothetical protein